MVSSCRLSCGRGALGEGELGLGESVGGECADGAGPHLSREGGELASCSGCYLLAAEDDAAEFCEPTFLGGALL